MDVQNEGQEKVLMEKSSNEDAAGKGKEKDNKFYLYSSIPKKSSGIKSVMHLTGIHEVYSLLDHFSLYLIEGSGDVLYRFQGFSKGSPLSWF
jgi:hypothetical protein